jgi:hypothetical protein
MSYDKYIKYKSKYLQLKAKYTQVGGAGLWTIFYKEGQKKTTPITQQESNALNKVISKNKGTIVIIDHGELKDTQGERLKNDKGEMNYSYVINADGKTGKRKSLSGTYIMILLPDDTQSASAYGAPPAYGAPHRSASGPPPRSAYTAPLPSTPPPLPMPPSDIPSTLSNLLQITKYFNENQTHVHNVLSVTNENLRFMKVNDELKIGDILFNKVSDTQINMKYNNITYPLTHTRNGGIWIYEYTYREVEV